MKRIPIEEIEKMSLNRYEAVILASKHARKLNTKRLTLLEQMEENPEIDIDSRKITMVALADLVEGRVKFQR